MYDLSRNFTKALATNANTSSFASKIPTVTEPSGDGIHDIRGPGLEVPQRILLLPYGLGSDNDVFDMRLIGWKRIYVDSKTKPTLWVPMVLAGLSATISAAVGVANSPVLNTERFADTITVTSGYEPDTTADTTNNGTFVIQSPTNDLVAWAIVNLYGVEKIEFTFDQTTNTPTCNCLFALL